MGLREVPLRLLCTVELMPEAPSVSLRPKLSQGAVGAGRGVKVTI